MSLSTTEVQQLVAQYFHIQGTARPLSGEVDLNYLIETDQGQRYCFKIAHSQTSVAELDFQNAMMEHLQAAKLALEIPVPVFGVGNEKIITRRRNPY